MTTQSGPKMVECFKTCSAVKRSKTELSYCQEVCKNRWATVPTQTCGSRKVMSGGKCISGVSCDPRDPKCPDSGHTGDWGELLSWANMLTGWQWGNSTFYGSQLWGFLCVTRVSHKMSGDTTTRIPHLIRRKEPRRFTLICQSGRVKSYAHAPSVIVSPLSHAPCSQPPYARSHPTPPEYVVSYSCPRCSLLLLLCPCEKPTRRSRNETVMLCLMDV